MVHLCMPVQLLTDVRTVEGMDPRFDVVSHTKCQSHIVTYISIISGFIKKKICKLNLVLHFNSVPCKHLFYLRKTVTLR